MSTPPAPPPPPPSRTRTRTSPQTGSSATPTPSSTQTAPPTPPTATTALAALNELRDVIEQYPQSKFALTRKNTVFSFINHIKSLVVIELAAAQAGSPVTSAGASAPGASDTDLHSLQAAMLSTHKAIDSLRGDLQQVVAASVREALAAPSTATDNSHLKTVPAAPRPPRDGPRHLDVTIGIPRGSSGASLATIPACQLKDEVDAALDACGVVGLAGTRVRGVRALPNGSLRIRADTAEQADLLFRCDGAWLAHLRSLRGAQVERKSFTLVAQAVPVEFDPAAPSAAESLWRENSGRIPSKDALRGLRWLHPIHPNMRTASKREGSLVFTVHEKALANLLIYSTITVRGAICNVDKFIPPPTQCYHCQAFGHTAKACPRRASPSSVRCARCAGPHALRECSCPAKTNRCADGRRCTHIQARCANCEGPHQSFDSRCPTKVAEQAKINARFNTRSRYFDTDSFSPPVEPRARNAVVSP